MTKFLSVILTVIISVSALSITSYADEWKKNDKGYVYAYNDGTTAKTGWLNVGNNTYYINSKGVRATGWLSTTSGTKYFLDENGILVRNKQVKFKNAGSFYFLPNGKMAVDYCYKNGNSFYYYGSDGKLQYTANLKLGMDYSELYNAVDETYFVDTDSSFIYKDSEYNNTPYTSLYFFDNDKLSGYGYGVVKENASLKTIRDYYTNELGSKPTYTNSKTGECHWKFKTYYLNIIATDDYTFALYSNDCLVKKESARTTETNKSDASQSHKIYITKTGKKHHNDSTCNGGKYYESTLAEAQRRGLKPCNKCVN